MTHNRKLLTSKLVTGNVEMGLSIASPQAGNGSIIPSLQMADLNAG